jgi:predicted MFS family arabinose efflux permease
MSSAIENPLPTSEATPEYARRVALLALLVIFTANFFNYMDRMLVSAMEAQLTKAFELTDVQFGFLWSLFTIGYLACATPIGLMADRFNRCWLFAGCIVIWSAATVATGLASSRGILYVSRLFIGVGEAGCLIVGPALLSDYFVQKRRGRALSAFYLGQPLGGTAGYILPALVFRAGLDWPMSFYLAGVPGFALAVFIMLFRDPPRGGDEHAGHNHKPGKLADYVQLLKNRSLFLIILAQTFSVIILIPLLHFGKKYLLDRHNLTEGDATKVMLGVMVLGAVGIVLSGLLGDRLARRFQGAYALLAGIGYLIGFLAFSVAFRTEDRAVLVTAMALGGFCLFLCMPAVNTQIANVVHPTQRAAAWALAVLVLHLLGDTLAPPIFGRISEQLGRQTAFAYFTTALLLASICCFIAARTARADIERFVEEKAANG